MSYILEALKKAEAERLSGAAHASPLPPGFTNAYYSGAAPGIRRWLWLAAAAAAALASAAAWLAVRDRAPQGPAATPAMVAAAPLPPTAAPATAPVVAPAPTAPPSTALPAVPAHEKPVDEIPAREKPIKEQPAKKKPEKKAQPADDAAPKETTADAPVATLHDLPEQIRSEIPSLEIGGYIYSANRADRSVLINKRLLREGDEITPGLMLEQMTRDSMILNYRGYRYRASY